MRAIVFGGAGFIGSTICASLAQRHWSVTAVDGLMARTSGRAENVAHLPGVEFDRRAIEAIDNLEELVSGADLVVDALGWTKHLDALRDPLYDLELNLKAHLPLIAACAARSPKRVIYLGSRHQYGRAEASPITEATPLAPLDVQGIHKTAAEQHWRRVASAELPVASLRFGNTFGPNQPAGEGDIGLIGGFIRDFLTKGEVVLFGGARTRNLLYAPDLADALERFARAPLRGFSAWNVAGRDLSLGEIVSAIAVLTGGVVREEEMPAHIAAIEIGDAKFDGSKFAALTDQRVTPLAEALKQTIADFRQRL